MKILLVEDEKVLSNSIKKIFEDENVICIIFF